jgi:hypothetical protein
MSFPPLAQSLLLLVHAWLYVPAAPAATPPGSAGDAAPCTDSQDFYEENDTCAEAVAITLGGQDLRVHIQDPDWYSLRIPPQGSVAVNIFFAHVDANVDMRLWDGCGGNLLVYANSVTDNEQVIWINFSNEPVTYYCEVFVNPASDGRCNVYDMEAFGVSDNIGATYCQSTSNSTGQRASIRAEGSLSVTENDIRLVVSTIPPQQPGLFFYGPQELEIPFGNGWRCVGPGALGTFLLRPAKADSLGVLICPLDLENPRRPEGRILPGSTWYFQCWYRDPAGTGFRSNFSDGVEVAFQP